MPASYKTSTLSLLLVCYFFSLVVLIVIATCTAVFAPEAYKLLSEKEMIMLLFFGSYTGLGVGLFSAYLQRSNSGNKTNVGNIETVNTTTPEEVDLSSKN